MHMKTIISAVSLAVAMGLSGHVIAQDAAATGTKIGNTELSAPDAERVKVYCEDLNTRTDQATTGSETENADANAPATGEETGNIAGIELAQITLEQCIEGGFVEAAPVAN